MSKNPINLDSTIIINGPCNYIADGLYHCEGVNIGAFKTEPVTADVKIGTIDAGRNPQILSSTDRKYLESQGLTQDQIGRIIKGKPPKFGALWLKTIPSLSAMISKPDAQRREQLDAMARAVKGPTIGGLRSIHVEPPQPDKSTTVCGKESVQPSADLVKCDSHAVISFASDVLAKADAVHVAEIKSVLAIMKDVIKRPNRYSIEITVKKPDFRGTGTGDPRIKGPAPLDFLKMKLMTAAGKEVFTIKPGTKGWELSYPSLIRGSVTVDRSSNKVAFEGLLTQLVAIEKQIPVEKPTRRDK